MMHLSQNPKTVTPNRSPEEGRGESGFLSLIVRFAICLIAILCLAILSGQSIAVGPKEEGGKPGAAGVLDFEMEKLDGKKIHLSKEYADRVVLIVNVASKCGFTPQYEQLQDLHERYAKKGLAIVGIPCNQFGKQEPGTAAEIREFCTNKFGVTFDMLAKVDVNGESACDLYKFLTSKETNGEFAGPIRWNFEKFLVSRDGKVVQRFESRTAPDDKKVLDAIERELARRVTE